MRDDGWNSLLEEVSAFIAKNNIDVPNVDALYQPPSWRKAQNMKNSHHYFVELFFLFFIFLFLIIYYYRYATSGT